MSYTRNLSSQGGTTHDDYWSSSSRNTFSDSHQLKIKNDNFGHKSNNHHDYPGKYRDQFDRSKYARLSNFDYMKTTGSNSLKRRKFTASSWEDSGRHYVPSSTYSYESSFYSNSVPPSRSHADESTSTSFKRTRSNLDGDEPVFMSKDDIERFSPSRKDGIDALRETHLRYAYCAFLQDLGLRLELPQTTIGTAMVLCHRFFVRQSHACHDRFLIATAALFLSAKSEETARPINNVLRASYEILHKQDVTFLSYTLSMDLFEQYRERLFEAEQMILTTLNFELNVQHPYAPLTAVLNKIGLSQTVLVNLALSLVSEGLRSSLWLQFQPHHIAAGAAYLAAKLLNMDLTRYQNIWHEFQTSPTILQAIDGAVLNDATSGGVILLAFNIDPSPIHRLRTEGS